MFRLEESIDVDTGLMVTLAVFMGSGIAVFTVVIYSDCPYTCALDLKLSWFCATVVHVLVVAGNIFELFIFESAGILS